MTARVLVVDDIPVNVRLLEAKLSAEYFDVITASSGAEALEKVAAEAPDIVLLDVMMPGMDGFEVCRRMKADPVGQHIPVVMVTALNDRGDLVRGLEAGADDFLTKPVNDTALFARVKSLLRVKMLFDELRLREETSRQLGGIPQQLSCEELLRGVRILVVDDDRASAATIDSVLGAENNLTVVTDADEALRLAGEENVDLIVVSLTLQSADPLRLCSQLRSQEATRNCAILILIDDGDSERLAKALELGVNDYLAKPVDSSELRARAGSQIRYKRYHDELRGAYRESVTMALTDSLTNLYNRRYVTTHLENMRNADSAESRNAALLMIDIDHFKLVNDRYGHDAGDVVLKEVAERLKDSTRGHDLCARLGGEEFLVVISDTDQSRAPTIAERIRVSVAESPVIVDEKISIDVTVSVGIAFRAGPDEDPEQQLKRADEALYDAKRGGRDCVVMAA
jgi:two-component system cell cycle response regulator